MQYLYATIACLIICGCIYYYITVKIKENQDNCDHKSTEIGVYYPRLENEHNAEFRCFDCGKTYRGDPGDARFRTLVNKSLTDFTDTKLKKELGL